MVELPTPILTQPKHTPILETPNWQTKALTSRKIGGKRTFGVKHVNILAPLGISPPGLGPPDPSRLLALDPFSDAAQEVLNDTPVSILSSGHMDTPELTRQEEWTTESIATGTLARPTPVEARKDFYATLKADDRLQVASKYIENPSEHVYERLVGDAEVGSGRGVARRSAIRKVQPAQRDGKALCTLGFRVLLTIPIDVQTSEETRPIHFGDTTTSTSNFGTTAATYNGINPVDFSELRHRFIDTSPLKQASHKVQQQSLSVKPKSLTPEEAARDALILAFRRRESSRIQLNTNYSLHGALEFDERAKNYNTRREGLAALMPDGNLSIEDEVAFPWLSPKDTVEPQVCESFFLLH